jgi:hypothetical protein
VSLLLTPDHVVLYPAGELDPRGWREPGDEPAWEGAGNLQLQPGITDPRAADGGGRGPHDPARDHTGQLYLPPDAPVADGMAAVVRGDTYWLGQTRLMEDPTAGARAACWVSTVTGTRTWAEGGSGPEEPDG